MNTNFVGERIVALIMKNGISERQLSLDLGRSEGYINKITTGRRKLYVEDLLSICEYFKITPSQFFIETNTHSQWEFKLLMELEDNKEELKDEDFQFLIEAIRFTKKKNRK